jgi:hypothetical protein
MKSVADAADADRVDWGIRIRHQHQASASGIILIHESSKGLPEMGFYFSTVYFYITFQPPAAASRQPDDSERFRFCVLHHHHQSSIIIITVNHDS